MSIKIINDESLNEKELFLREIDIYYPRFDLKENRIGSDVYIMMQAIVRIERAEGIFEIPVVHRYKVESINIIKEREDIFKRFHDYCYEVSVSYIVTVVKDVISPYEFTEADRMHKIIFSRKDAKVSIA